MRAREFISERINPTGLFATAVRMLGNAIGPYIPAGLTALGTFAATTAVLGPIVAAMAGSSAGSAVLAQVSQGQNQADGVVKKLIDKYFGSESDALAFSVIHAKAAYLGQPEFRWGGQNWKVTLQKDQAEAIIEKNDAYWLQQNQPKQKPAGDKVKDVQEGGQRPGQESPISLKPEFRPGPLTGNKENPFKKPYTYNRPTNVPPGATAKEEESVDPLSGIKRPAGRLATRNR